MELGALFAVGNTARLYRRGDKTIKVFNEGFPDTEARNEADLQRFAHSHGLPVPEVFDVIRFDGWQAVVMEYIPGRTLGELMLADMENAEDYMNLFVDAQLNIHAVLADSLPGLSEWQQRNILSADLLEDEKKAALLRMLGGAPKGNRLCHGDYHPFNLILSDDGVTVIDWVNARAGSIHADVCYTYLVLLCHSPFESAEALADLYLRLYCEKSGLLKEDVLFWAPIVAGARLSGPSDGEEAAFLLEIVNRHIGGPRKTP